jgi:hypothetical protein
MLGKPVLEIEIGEFKVPNRSEYMAGNEVIRSIDDADQAIQRYLAGAPISADRQRARDAFIAHCYFRNDGNSSERCAELIHKTISAPVYTNEDRERTRATAAEAYAQWQRNQDTRLMNRIKDLLGIKRNVSMRFWKRLLYREAQDNLGLFAAEVDITPDMVEEFYQIYDGVLGVSAPAASGEASATDTASARA